MRLDCPWMLLSCVALACTPSEALNPLPGKDGGPEPPADAGHDAEPDAADGGEELNPPTTFVPTARGRNGGVSTIDQRASWAAIETLKSGGNAVDAAVAAAAMLGVTDPFSCGIGGGGFMLVYRADTNEIIVVEHREVTPLGMDRSAFYENGSPIPFVELVTSGRSVGVPGVVRGWDEALRRYGQKGFTDLFKYAIYVAEKGFDVDQTFFDQTTRNIDRFRQIPSTAELFLTPDGEPKPIGQNFANPDLAATYRLIAEQGVDGFYHGPIAQAIVDTIAEPPVAPGSPLNVRPGFMTLSDLSAYQARIRPAVMTAYRDYAIYGAGLPTSGGLTIEMTMNLLEDFDPTTVDAAGWLHRFIESSRISFSDRNAYMGDLEFVSVPVSGMLSKDYADARRVLINVAQAATAPVVPGTPSAYQVDPSFGVEQDAFIDLETSHITVVDAAGNAVAYTCTIESEGGNGMVVPGRGFLLNNELTDFNIPTDPTASHPNVLEPGKRPRSSMSPMMVFKDDKLVLALGSPGGSTIITTVGQIMTTYLDLSMPIDEALAAPRVSQRNASDLSSAAEPAFLATPEAAALQAMGHILIDAGPIGAATAIEVAADGALTVAAEPVRRGGGSAMVVDPR